MILSLNAIYASTFVEQQSTCNRVLISPNWFMRVGEIRNICFETVSAKYTCSCQLYFQLPSYHHMTVSFSISLSK